MKEKSSRSFLVITFVLIIALPAYNSISYFLSLWGIPFLVRMYHIYLILDIYLIVLLGKYKFSIKKIFVFFAVLAFYGVNYCYAKEETRLYYSADVLVSLFVALPISCLAISRITNWNDLFDNWIYLYIVDGIIVFSLLSKVSAYNGSDYMSYSYSLLPLWGICYVSALYYNHTSQWFFWGIGIAEGLLYGARAPIAWIAVLALVTWMILLIESIKKRDFKKIIPISLFLIGIVICVVGLIFIVWNCSSVDGSYILKRLQDGSFFISAGRSQLYVECENVIRSIGCTINGLFYDRTVLPNGWYAHSFVYEAIISFGWPLGILFIVTITYAIVRAFLIQDTAGKIIISYVFCSFFLRYFISGSIFDEPGFIMFVAMIYSLQSKSI